MKTIYHVTRSAYNALGDRLPDLVLSRNENNTHKFASLHERTFTPVDYENEKLALHDLKEIAKNEYTQSYKLLEGIGREADNFNVINLNGIDEFCTFTAFKIIYKGSN